MPVPTWLPRARHTRRSLLLAGLLWCVALGAVLGSWRPLLQALLPVQAAFLRSMTDAFDLGTLELRRQGVDESLVATLRVRSPLRQLDGRQVIVSGGATVTASVSAAKALLPLLLVATVLILWPVMDRREYAVRAVLGALATMATMAADLPAVLLGQAWGVVREAVPGLAGSPLQAAGLFMESGGRLGLSLAMGLMAVVAARWLADGWQER